MKVLDIITEASSILGLEAEKEILQNEENTEAEMLANAEIKKLFNLMQFSLRELCTNYLNVVKDEAIDSENKSIALSSLHNYVRLQGVKFNGEMVHYKVVNRKIILPFDAKFNVEFLTYPNIESLQDEMIDLGISNLDVVVLGLCAYYCLASGRFEEFNSFHSQYIDRASSIKTIKSVHLPLRRWE